MLHKNRKNEYDNNDNNDNNYNNTCNSNNTIVGFFISVSSLKVFGHSIHSERRRIYPGKSIQALQNDTIIISWLFSFRINGAVAYFKNFYVSFHRFIFITKPLQGIRLLST